MVSLLEYSWLIIEIQWFHYWDTVVSLLGYSGFIIEYSGFIIEYSGFIIGIQWFHYWDTVVSLLNIVV